MTKRITCIVNTTEGKEVEPTDWLTMNGIATISNAFQAKKR